MRRTGIDEGTTTGTEAGGGRHRRPPTVGAVGTKGKPKAMAAAVVLVLGAAGLVPGGTGVAGAATGPGPGLERACPSPTITGAGGYGGGAMPPTIATGTALDVQPGPAVLGSSFDMDGDGQADTVTTTTDDAGPEVTITRQSDTVTLTDLPYGLTLTAATSADLDGDGKDELWGTIVGPGMQAQQATLVVPGSTSAGSHDITDIARVFLGGVVGDLSGDGRDDAKEVVPLTFLTPTRVRYRSFVGQLDPATAGTGFPAGGSIISGAADLDFDGIPDQILESDGTNDGGTGGSAVQLSTGTGRIPLVPLQGPQGTYTNIAAIRAGSQIYLVTNPADVSTSHLIFQVATGCSNAWMHAVSHRLWGEDPQPGDFPTVVEQHPADPLVGSERAGYAAQAATSLRAERKLIADRYHQLLDRSPDPAGRTYWERTITKDHTKTQGNLYSTLLGSAEAYRRYGGNSGDRGQEAGNWVEQLYVRVLGRDPDPSGLGYWARQEYHYGPARTAARFLQEAGSKRAIVRATYLQLFDRQPSALWLSLGLTELAHRGIDGLQGALAGGDDFYLQAQVDQRYVATS